MATRLQLTVNSTPRGATLDPSKRQGPRPSTPDKQHLEASPGWHSNAKALRCEPGGGFGGVRVDASAEVFFRNPGRSRCWRFVVLGLHDLSAVMLSCSGVLLREAAPLHGVLHNRPSGQKYRHTGH